MQIEVLSQPGLLDQLAENIAKDSYNYICKYIPHYFNNLIINSSETVVNSHSSNPNWFDYYCSIGYDAIYNVLDPKVVSDSVVDSKAVNNSKSEVVVISQAVADQNTN